MLVYSVTGDALFQVFIGPVESCIHLWPLAEYNEVILATHNSTQLESLQTALFTTINNHLKEHYCNCKAEFIDWVITCQAKSHEVLFKYFLHLSSEHCNCSATEVVLVVERWVKSSGVVKMGMYHMRANSTCQPVRIESLDGLDCISKK